jgi:hypothetical protein
MQLKPLTANDNKIWGEFLRFSRHELSSYTFGNIYIWKALYNVSWCVVDENLCVFFRDKTGCFLYLPPVGRQPSAVACAAAFDTMDSINANREISRIENIEQDGRDFYRRLGYAIAEKPGEYLCSRKDLVNLRGDAFKSKRACVNFFFKHYSFECFEYSPQYHTAVVQLYRLWMGQRSSKYREVVYLGMLDDSRRCLEVLLGAWGDLGYAGMVVTVEGVVAGFTCGFPVNDRTFCVAYEITDISIKGLAQYIFREFCFRLKGYTYINVMDDSGLDNLKEVKLSYRPERKVPAYIATRNHAH